MLFFSHYVEAHELPLVNYFEVQNWSFHMVQHNNISK